MEHSLKHPELYKDKWLVWPHTVMNDIDIVDCNDTIQGICTKGKTLYECIDSCKGDCAAGYHVQYKNGESVCVPVRTNIHPRLNPVFRLRDQAIYPQLSDVEVNTFVNEEVYPFPPDAANVVFYRDILTIKNAKTDDALDTQTDDQGFQGFIYMNKKDGDNIQILPASNTTSQEIQYRPVHFGDPIHFSIPATSLVARVSTEHPDRLVWDITTGMFRGDDYSFSIVPVSGEEHKMGNAITYDDEFMIVYS